MRVGTGQRRRGVGQMPDLGVNTGVLGDRQGHPEGGELVVGFGPLGFVGDGEVGEDAHDPQEAPVLVLHGFAHEPVPVRDGCAVAAQSGVDLQVDACRTFLFAGRRNNPLQLPAGAPDVDPGGHCGGEVALAGVQPGEHWGFDPGRAQGQGLGDVGDAQPAGPGAEGRAGNGDGAMAVRVGLNHRHDLCR